MKLSIYIPKELEEPLRKEAAEVGESPSMYLQSLLRERIAQGVSKFSDAFVALAGSWEDDRTVDEIVRDIAQHRITAERASLR